ncbi:C39 family peptidase [Burkholderiaceae bacterium DAT-1]|nr:C39 family peptidase [Burkholderiaceae bacterium DAT-1]
MVGAGPVVDTVSIKPASELKFKNIVHQAFDYSCGSAALTTILKFHLGVEVSEQGAMEGMMDKGEKEKIIARRGFSLLDMKRYVASLGFDSAGFRATIDDLRKLDQPAVIPIDFGGSKHFVVYRGIREGLVYIADPSAGNIVFTEKQFAGLWDKNTLFIVYPAKDRPAIKQLALNEYELGVIDMDLVLNRGELRPIDGSVVNSKMYNGVGNIHILRN